MSSIQGIGGVQQPVDIQGMDLETAMLAVQSNRASLLEEQLKTQMEGVQKKNDQIARLNGVLTALTGVQGTFDGNAKSDSKLSDMPKYKENNYAVEREVNDALIAAGVTNAGYTTDPQGGATNQLDKNGKEVRLAGGMRQEMTKGEVEKAIAAVKSQIDALSNSQQMDMLRLQSLSNKRNEAFDLMTNFIKKMQDSRSSIIGNMR